MSNSNCNFSIFVIAHLRYDYCSPYKGLCVITRVCRPSACVNTSFPFTSGLQKEKILSCPFQVSDYKTRICLKSHKISMCAFIIVYHLLVFFLAIIIMSVNYIFGTFPCYQLHDKFFLCICKSGYGLL